MGKLTEGNPKVSTHGLYMPVGRTPPGTLWVRGLVSSFRRAIVGTLQADGRVLGPYEQAVVQSAARWEQHALLAQRWLRLEADTMTASERLAYSKAIAQASVNRDSCLRELGLKPSTAGDVLEGLYAAFDDEPDAEPADAENATEGQP